MRHCRISSRSARSELAIEVRSSWAETASPRNAASVARVTGFSRIWASTEARLRKPARSLRWTRNRCLEGLCVVYSGNTMAGGESHSQRSQPTSSSGLATREIFQLWPGISARLSRQSLYKSRSSETSFTYIYPILWLKRAGFTARKELALTVKTALVFWDPPVNRSEERRVGKEGRSR